MLLLSFFFKSIFFSWKLLLFFHVPGCSGMFHVPNFIDAASVQGFALKQPNIFSDHSQIVCWIKIGTDLSNNNNNFQDICSKIHCCLSFRWYSVFITSLRKYKIRFKQYRCWKCNQSIHKYYDWGSKTFTQITHGSQNKSKRKPITKKWFDYDCKTLRSSLKKLSNKKQRNPLDTELRKEYHVQNKTF